MMSNIVEKYKCSAIEAKVEYVGHRYKESSILSNRGISGLNRRPAEEDKIEVYKAIRST